MLGRRAAGVSSSCNLLRRRPREPADPGLVAKSDVVSRIKTEEGRKPAVGSSTGRGVPSGRSVLEAPGGLSAEPCSWPPSSPPRRFVFWAGECLPLSHLCLRAQPSLTRVFPAGSLGSRGLRRLRQSGAASRAWFLYPAGDWAPEKPAAAEPAPTQAKSEAENQSRGLAGKWMVATGGFIFRARQLGWRRIME